MLSAKQGGIKYRFLSLWYNSTWDWTSVSGPLAIALLEDAHFFYLAVNKLIRNKTQNSSSFRVEHPGFYKIYLQQTKSNYLYEQYTIFQDMQRKGISPCRSKTLVNTSILPVADVKDTHKMDVNALSSGETPVLDHCRMWTTHYLLLHPNSLWPGAVVPGIGQTDTTIMTFRIKIIFLLKKKCCCTYALLHLRYATLSYIIVLTFIIRKSGGMFQKNQYHFVTWPVLVQIV